VLDLIKGQRVSDAFSTLAFTRSALPVRWKNCCARRSIMPAYLSRKRALDVDVDDLLSKAQSPAMGRG